MPTMNISLTDDLKRVVEKRMADGRYSSASEYVRELIRADEQRARAYELPSIIDPDDYDSLSDERREREADKLEALLLEGMQGEAVEVDEQFWTDLRERAKARRQARQKRAAHGND